MIFFVEKVVDRARNYLDANELVLDTLPVYRLTMQFIHIRFPGIILDKLIVENSLYRLIETQSGFH